MIAYMITGEGNISLVLKGNQYYVTKNATNYQGVLDGIKSGATEDELIALCDVAKKVDTYMSGTGVTVNDGVVTFEGEEIHNTLTERIVAFMRDGLPTEPLINFLKKLMSNPSFSARKELFDFLEHKSLPITEDGDFLAYKAVNANFTDKHTGKVDNSVGTVVTMPRHRVDDDRNNGCSSGYHAGTLEYVNGFGGGDDKYLIVKINPTNVVSVPSDCNCQKLRTCEYLVLSEYTGELKNHLYSDDGGEYEQDECPDCGEPEDYCTCEDDYCENCGCHINDCDC